VEDIASTVRAPARSVLADLEHVRRGLKAPERWILHQAECQSCGFVFRGRERLNTPSRCPQCKSEAIQDPTFEIGEK
jgi:predicted Zn-ribbon and HTH transcriptional regulator